MYFIGSVGDGTVVVRGSRVKLHEGDFFGEMALLEHRPPQACVVADTVAASTCWTARGWRASTAAIRNRQAYQGSGEGSER
jgi:hypothetical protein